MTTFAELTVHPALARALSERGYETATSVQATVMDARYAGQDLLISSQTGSGKTLAFGMLMADTLLGATASPSRRPRPVALVIVPTRELAVQVRDELGWVLKHTGLRLASFTGGTSVVGDLRALQRGVDVVVGTPGRLVDLLKRKQLALLDLAMVVLDEADEMLDLGFREDLETLLEAAPATRRTLMLSATLPPEIRALARRFQRDAVAVDPRKDGAAAGGAGAGAAAAGGDAASHGDITYVAHLVAGSDRLAAVVNVLRAFNLKSGSAGLKDGSAARAIVFVTTRDSVSGLHAALTARGFAATAISGDRAQTERDRALEQVKSGAVQILVATNVAARGLHLPDVDLIVHADLPLNAESLTHRSGRTGRAGRKGTAVLIATPAERRKAERLLATARVRAPWTAPPSEKDIAAAARDHLIAELQLDPEEKVPPEADELLRRMESAMPAGDLLRRLVARELARLPGGESLRSIPPPGPDSRDEGPAPRRPRAEFSRAGVLFRINLGGKDKADPRWMLPLICRRGGVTRREVGAIRIGERETLFEIAGDAAADFALAAAEQDPRAMHVQIQRADAAPGSGDQPHRAPERPRPRPDRTDHGGHREHQKAATRPTAAPKPAAGPKPPAAPKPPVAPKIHPKRAQRERAHSERPPAERAHYRDRQPGGHTPLRRKPNPKGR